MTAELVVFSITIMKKINFLKGTLYVNDNEIIVLNGSLGDRYSESDLEALNRLNISGMASIPYRQKTLLTGEFSQSPDSFDSAWFGKAKFVCPNADGVLITYNLELLQEYNNNILASEVIV